MAEVKNPDASKDVSPEDTSTNAGSVKEKLSGATASAKEKFSGATSEAKRRINKAGDSMKSAASGARQKYGEVKEKIGSTDYRGLTSDLRTYVRENPGKAIVVATGIGFLLGLLMRDSEE